MSNSNKITMKRSELLELHRTLAGLHRITATKFSYAVARNLRILQPEVEAFEASQKINHQSELVEYERKRRELVNQFGSRDTNGKLLVDETGVTLMRDYEGFQKALLPIKEKYAEALGEREAKEPELRKLLEEEVELDTGFFRIKAEVLPDGLTPPELFHLLPLIDGDFLDKETKEIPEVEKGKNDTL